MILSLRTKMPVTKNLIIILLLAISFSLQNCIAQQNNWLHFKPENAQAKNKKIVLISGDEEYRSEESLPMLAKILTRKHGFETVVLFSINPSTNQIDPEYQKNIPGLENLKDADLMIIATRFRELPDNQMKYIDDYLKAGKPVIGLRTATHAFNFAKESTSPYKHYGYSTADGDWKGGFGVVVLGETWINHHGDHGTEGSLGLPNGLQVNAKNPILLGVGDIWVPSDVYGIQNDLKNSNILVWGQPTLGMTEDSPVNKKKSIMPVAWTKEYQLPNGKKGKAFTTTMASSIDLLDQNLRRLLVNASYWAVGMEKDIKTDFNIDPIGEYNPIMFGFGTHVKGKTPKDYQ
ncbi:ThuA domain-containing protein [Sphingobacterium daejeonense]|uniref:ThuA domain-containing protein n=1 Tax=Sphingobacterium daejeonense TaxID=371142 RepID=UPI0010C5B095|nr:ThuA domain-containing protein [Sphingobacterium daejeonense]VTQ06859.1 Trehalose utilisation [Sphingobacterium daejeonense]